MSAGSNSFGTLFKWTTFGESHGPAMGVVIDGCPSGLSFDEDLLVNNLKKRKPGQVATTDRKENDEVEVLSGVFEGKTLGTPMALVVKNQNQKSDDYEKIKNQPRTGHADDVWSQKFSHRDHRGGGRASARETVNWVMAGSVAQMLVKHLSKQSQVSSHLISVGGETVKGIDDPQLIEKLNAAKKEGESFGAIVAVNIDQPPALIGEPIFKKSKSLLAQAFMTINACVGVELGEGFAMAQSCGTQVHQQSDSPLYGGIRGGISTGEKIHMKLAFKPTSSILDVAKRGRHDPCVALRALPIVEAMTWAVLADLLLMKRLNQL